MGWWITLAVLVLLAVLPLGVSVKYDEDGPLVKVIVGFLRLKVFPAKKKKKKPKKDKKKKSSQKPEEQAEEPAAPEPAQKPAPGRRLWEKAKAQAEAEQKKGGSILDFLPLLKLGLNFLGEFFGRKLRVNRLELKITLAGGDPCDLALNYGKAWEALGNLWPRLEEMLVIKKRDVEIQCDFEGDKTLIYTRLDISITLGRLLGLVVRYAVKALVAFLKISKKRKGGAKT